MGEQQNRRRDDDDAGQLVACAVVSVLLVAGFVWLMVSIARRPPSRAPDYMVSITGVDGLDPTTTLLSPVVNLTVRIDNSGNRNAWDGAEFVWGLSTAVVSYGGAFLGSGSVPAFCAAEEEVQERAATAWGDGVALPRFLRERLRRALERAEEALALDVQVTMPARCADCSDKVLVCGEVQIGGGFRTCQVERVYVRPPAPAAGQSTG